MHNQVTDYQVERLRRIIDVMRVFDHQIPAQVLSVFFYVAAHDGCLTSGMAGELNIAQSSISRCTDWLSDYHRLGKPGMGLVVKKKDPYDSRLRRVYLTDKGQSLVNQIKEILDF